MSSAAALSPAFDVRSTPETANDPSALTKTLTTTLPGPFAGTVVLPNVAIFGGKK